MKNLKKVSCAALVCVLLSVLFVMPSYAAGFGGGSRGGEFSGDGFGGSTAQTRLSYDALSDLCVDVNERLAKGEFGSAVKSYGCRIYQPDSSDFYVIMLRYNGSNYYYRNASGGVYYTTERPSILNSIYGQLWSTYNGVRTDIAVLTRKILERMDTITPIIEGLPGYLWGTYNGEKVDIGGLSASMVVRLDNTNTKLDRIIAIYLIKPSLLPFFIKRKEIGRRVGINDMTKEICDEYFFVPFIAGGTKLIFCPPLWKLFNTLSRKPLPEKTWEKW